MLSVCYRYTKSKSDAEDVFQEGFLKVFENLKTLKNSGAIEWWMKRIFINTALQQYHKRKKELFVDDFAECCISETETNDILKAIEKDEILMLIQDLPEKMQIVFNLYIIEGFPHKDIAEMLNISINTSKAQVHKARNILKSEILKEAKLADKEKFAV